MLQINWMDQSKPQTLAHVSEKILINLLKEKVKKMLFSLLIILVIVLVIGMFLKDEKKPAKKKEKVSETSSPEKTKKQQKNVNEAEKQEKLAALGKKAYTKSKEFRYKHINIFQLPDVAEDVVGLDEKQIEQIEAKVLPVIKSAEKSDVICFKTK